MCIRITCGGAVQTDVWAQPQSFWFSWSGMEPGNLCYWQVPRWWELGRGIVLREPTIVLEKCVSIWTRKLTYRKMFIAALFLLTPKYTDTKFRCPSIVDWIDKSLYIHLWNKNIVQIENLSPASICTNLPNIFSQTFENHRKFFTWFYS